MSPPGGLQLVDRGGRRGLRAAVAVVVVLEVPVMGGAAGAMRPGVELVPFEHRRPRASNQHGLAERAVTYTGMRFLSSLGPIKQERPPWAVVG